MDRPQIVYCSTHNEIEYRKWSSSSDYDLMVEKMFSLIKSDPESYSFLFSPFVSTLGATLEATLNDFLIIDTFEKYSVPLYKNIADGYISTPFKTKIRLTVAVLSNNQFALVEDSNTIKDLDALIAERNKLMHPRANFFFTGENGSISNHKQQSEFHPVRSLTFERIERYYHAFGEFNRGFIDLYDKNELRENSFLQEMKFEYA